MMAENERPGPSNEGRFKPPPDFEDDKRNCLIESALSATSELWLIQWPKDQLPDFDGQELSLKLNNDGLLGKFEGSSGKSYDVISYSALTPEANVFTSSKIAGKISRRVSFVHYPEPSELLKPVNNSLKQLYQRSSGTSRTYSSLTLATTSQSNRLKSSKSMSSKGGSALETTKLGKRKHKEEPSSAKSSGSHQHSSEKKSKKKQKVDTLN